MDAEREATIQEQERLAREGSRLLDVVDPPYLSLFNHLAGAQFNTPRRRILRASRRNIPNKSLLPQISHLSSADSNSTTTLPSPPTRQHHSQ
jgi:hypothetical protein